MAYLLASTSIRRPNLMKEENSTQVAQNRTLAGSISRDYFGSNKRVWTLTYDKINTIDWATINSLYQAYLLAGNAVAWQVTEGNYPVSPTTVHIDLMSREFAIAGSTYLSGCDLILTEA